MLERVKRKGNLPTLFVEMKIGEATMEKSIEVLKKKKNPKNRIPYDPATPLLSIYTEKIII